MNIHHRTPSLRFPSILALVFLLVGSLAIEAHAGAWVDTSTVSITRANLGGGTYEVTVSFKVRRSSTPPGAAGGTLKSDITVVEDDPCFDDLIHSGSICIDFPPSGGLTSTQTFTYTYPCSWGDDIAIEVANQTGFTGVSHAVSGLPFGASPEDCGPGVSTGGLGLTPRVRGDEVLHPFFRNGRQNPVIPVTQSIDGTTGQSILGFTTLVLPDLQPIGYSFYLLTIFEQGGVSYQTQLSAAGSSQNPNQIPDEQQLFGPPTRFQSVPLDLLQLSGQTSARIEAIDTSNRQRDPISVYEGSIQPAPPEILARFGNLNTQNGPPYDSLLVNGSRGGSDRSVTLDRNNPLVLSFLPFPGAQSSFPYVLYALPRENHAGDLTPQPFGLGDACFSTFLTGGGSITLLNSLGLEPILGTPRLSSAIPAPGTVLNLNRPGGLPVLDLTLQAILPDSCSPNGRAGLSNAVVARIR